ncbi:MAG: TIGR03943 family protein, partial [Desulfobacterales bacterium]|nr:TIGR03943 family protein [Desulfobacterales bacterium]
ASLAAAGSSRGRDHLLKGLILMLPILFIFASGNKTLGNFALSKRSMTPLEVNGPNNTDPTESRENLNPDTGEKNLPGTGSPLVSISDLVRQFNTYDGRRISVEGLFSNTVEGHDELSAVFRYFITCCAADAMPVGVFMAGQGAAGIEDNQWVRAAGRVSAREMDGYTVIYMDLEKLEKKEMPSKNAAYLF